jgi:16S rRNA processing protein RimM
LSRTAGRPSGQEVAEEDGGGRLIIVGRIMAPYGIRGWVKVFSETEPRENIVGYSPWWIRSAGKWERRQLAAGRPHGKGMIAHLSGCEDRDAAAALSGAEIAVQRSQLADDLAPGEYYWADLEGLHVVTEEGVSLGRVDHLFETGANDVMVVKGERERLIPYLIGQVVKGVDLDAGEVRVDWDPEF